MLLNCKQGCKNIYNMINTHKVECKFKVKWNKDLTLNINGLKNKLGKQYEDQYHLNIEVNKVDKFTYQLINGVLIETYSVPDIQTVYIFYELNTL